MEKDFDALLDKELSRIEKDLSNQTPPKVVYNPKKKTISVQYDFMASLIKKVKLIATSDEWIKIYNQWDFDHDISFEDIALYFSRLAKYQKIELQNYAKDEPELFSSDVLICVESAVLFKRIVKPRKPSPYGLDWQEKIELSAQATYLYAFLTYESKKVSEDDWPDYFKNFLEAYDLSPIDFKKNDDRQEAVRKIMSIYIDGNPNYFAESFFQTFVTESPIKIARIKKLKSISRSPIENTFLNPLFREFIQS